METDYKEIVTTNHVLIKVSNSDYDRVCTYRWSHCIKTGYAFGWIRINGKLVRKSMHTFILDVDRGGMYIDHINENKKDNRRSNLRLCTFQENLFNRSEPNMNNARSRYKGVNWEGKHERWMSSVCVNYKKYHLLSSKIEDECAYARNLANLHIFGPSALIVPESNLDLSDTQKEKVKSKVSSVLKRIPKLNAAIV